MSNKEKINNIDLPVSQLRSNQRFRYWKCCPEYNRRIIPNNRYGTRCCWDCCHKWKYLQLLREYGNSL